MQAGKCFSCVCVLLWALAIGSTVRVWGSQRQLAGGKRAVERNWKPEPAGLGAFEEQLGEEPEAWQLQPHHVLPLYEARVPDVTSAIIHYLKQDGQRCVKKRLALSIVGVSSGRTTVASVLKKLSDVFGVSVEHPGEELIFSAGSAWQSLLKPEPFQPFLLRDLDPNDPLDRIDPKTPIKHLCACTLFVGRAVSHGADAYTCAHVSLDDTSLAALPVATEAALPALIMEADRPDEVDAERGEATAPAVSSEELLKRMAPTTARFYSHGVLYAAAGTNPWPEEDERDPYVYLHAQHQLDLLFPAGTYNPVSVVTPPHSIKVGSRAVHAYPACNSSYVCTAWRNLRLTDFPWEALKDTHRPDSLRHARQRENWRLVARLLAARAGSETEQHPQVVLLELFKDEDNQQEHWIELPLQWAENPEEEDQSTGERLQATAQTFRQVLGAYARFSNSLTRLLPESSLWRLLTEKMIQLYNINKEEMYSMWDKDRKHSAVYATTVEGVFTRPINTPIFRPINPRDVLVSPADSVIQHQFQLLPDSDGEIRDLLIPQIKDSEFYLSEFLYGHGVEKPIHLANPKNRLNVIVHHLSPHDYHRIHSPADWITENVYHVPACFLPDANKRPAAGSTLHAVERTSLIGTWDPDTQGEKLFFAVVLVGAEYTGGIRLAWEDQPTYSRHPFKRCANTEVTGSSQNVRLCLGEELGEFRFGSTVVLIFETSESFEMNVNMCDAVLVGQTEGRQNSVKRKVPQECSLFPSAFDSALEYLNRLRADPDGAGKQIMKNTLLPPSWRKDPKTAAEEIARSLEKGLLFARALAQQLLLLYSEKQEYWDKIVLGQPAALLKSGGKDASVRRIPVICYPDSQKENIRVKFQGLHSTIVLIFRTTKEDAILFNRPHFGCGGHTHLGNRAGGLKASWELRREGTLRAKVTATSGLGGEHACVEPTAAQFVEGHVDVTAKCRGHLNDEGSGTTVAECQIQKVAPEVASAITVDIRTREFVCPDPTRSRGPRHLQRRAAALAQETSRELVS